MKKQEVYILTILHQHGQNVYAHRSYEGAYKALAKFCRTYWLEVSSTKAPKNNQQCVTKYFERQGDESWAIETVLLEQ